MNGLGVVVNRKGKKTMIVEARYVNLFNEYKPFLYEWLSDLQTYLRGFAQYQTHQLRPQPALGQGQEKTQPRQKLEDGKALLSCASRRHI